MNTDDLRKPLDALALSLLRDCSENATGPDGEVIKLSTDAKVDVFKAVASYYVACNRAVGRSKKIEDVDATGDFNAIVSRLKSAQQTGGQA